MFKSLSVNLLKNVSFFFNIHSSKSGFVHYTKNIQWFLIAKIFSMALSMVTTVIMARILGPNSFGTLSYVLSFVGLFAVLSNLGIDNVLYKELVLHKEKREEILGSAITLKLATGILALFTCFAVVLLTNQPTAIKALILLLSFSFITQTFSLFGYDFYKDGESKYVTYAQIISQTISNSLKISVIYLYSSLLLFVGILIIEQILTGLLYIYQIKKRGRTLALKVSKARILALLVQSIPLTIFSASTEIYTRIDQIMIAHYINTTTVGLYAAATRLTEIWYTIPNILIGALFPALMNSYGTPEKYTKRFRFLMIVLIFLAILISTCMVLFGKYIILFIYGESFSKSYPILAIYSLSLVGSFTSALINIDLLVKKRVWISAAISAITCLFNIALNILLIPNYETAGAAIATVISYSMIPVIYLVYVSLEKKKAQLKN